PAPPDAPRGVAAALLLRAVVDEERVEVQRVRQDVVADRRPADAQRVVLHLVLALGRQRDVPQERVHRDVDAVHRALHDGAVLQLDRDALVVQLHEEAHELHGSLLRRPRARGGDAAAEAGLSPAGRAQLAGVKPRRAAFAARPTSVTGAALMARKYAK
ncbi:unnamed protein product, partial [Pelagomonas calceolata]